MEQVPERISFPAEEENVLKYWEKIEAFKTSLKKSEGKPEYTFYDGPPFATGLPHYGHILAGTIKDIVTRYATQTGHHVVRRFGWDCHGLPIEFEIDKELGIRTKEDVLKLGIPKYNAACRGIVMRYAGEWEKIVTRLGRWIDFKNDYKTLNTSFMESVWWVFKEIYKKDMVYKGFKVMPYSTGCTTPLSNFEANSSYKEVVDPAVVVSFPLESDPTVSFVAWTTTPWTLPSNLALCVNPEMDYVKVKSVAKGETFILLEKRLVELFKDASEYTVVQKYKGKELKGLKYVPLFDYFASQKANGAFVVVADGYVTEDSGTGIVHMAPAFGEDDYRVCADNGIIKKGESLICPVDSSGNFTSEVTHFAGRYVKDADKDIIKHLKTANRLVKNSQLSHSYPFCWRSDTPLIYRAVPSWFINVEKIVDRLLVNNKQSYWVPDYVQEKRFHNWLESACDWAVSRNRYWGTPIPIWISDDGEERVVVGSVQELEELTGVKGITDLHRESIDHLTIPSKQGKGVLKRVEEVFDCWFESGSMPYAQNHYPFENKELFEHGFPADFIAEGIDQTRGWFYTLLVISTILYDKAPFKNLIVNGLVLAADGKKMSKRLKNYPDPMRVVDEYGADALRLYLINSPVVRAENLKFKEEGVRNVIKDVFLPWFNAYRFLTEAMRKYRGVNPTFVPSSKLALQTTNIMDKWILASTNSLVGFVRDEMKAYRLYTVVPQLVKYIDQLTNWYVRLNRKRMKGSGGEQDTQVALSTLFEVVYTITRVMSPFTPYITEYFYQNLAKLLPKEEVEESLHYLPFPEVKTEFLNAKIELAVSRMQSVIQLGRTARDRRNLPVKFPLASITVVQNKEFLQDVTELKDYIIEELNVRDVLLSSDNTSVVTSAKPDFDVLGKRLRGDMGKVQKAIAKLTHEQIVSFQATGEITLEGHKITSAELQVVKKYNGDTKRYEAAWDENVVTMLDVEATEEMKEEGLAREIMNRVQKLRKKAGISFSDPIEVFYRVDAKGPLANVVVSRNAFIRNVIGVGFNDVATRPLSFVEIINEEATVLGAKIFISVSRLALSFSEKALKEKFEDSQFILDVQTYLHSKDYDRLLKSFVDKKYSFTLNEKQVTVELNKDVFPSVHARLNGNAN